MTSIEEWRTQLRTDYTSGTVHTRVGGVLAVANRLGCQPHEITAELLGEWLAVHPLKTWTRRSYFTSLRQYAAWAGIDDPTATLRIPPPPRSVPNPLPEHELELLLAYCTDRDRLWVLLGAYCGLRVHEVAQLAWADVIDFGAGRTMLRVHGKGDTVDLVPAPPVVVEALNTYRSDPDDLGWCFPSRAKAGHWQPSSIAARIRRLAARLGIRMRFHMLRHRYGTAVHRLRRDLLLTQTRMRHRNPTSTAGYAQVADDDAHAVVDELPGALPLPGPRTPHRETGSPCTTPK